MLNLEGKKILSDMEAELQSIYAVCSNNEKLNYPQIPTLKIFLADPSKFLVID
jgi:hypothetical protein